MAVYEYRGIQSNRGKPAKGSHYDDNVKALRALLHRDGV